MLNGMTIMKGSTGITIVGGTSTVLDTDGADVKGGIHVVDMTEANFLLRTHLTYKNKSHALQPNGTYSKGYRNVIVSMPHLLADGTMAYAVGRITLELHPQLTSTQVNEIRRLTVQAISDPDADNFYLYGAVK